MHINAMSGYILACACTEVDELQHDMRACISPTIGTGCFDDAGPKCSRTGPCPRLSTYRSERHRKFASNDDNGESDQFFRLGQTSTTTIAAFSRFHDAIHKRSLRIHLSPHPLIHMVTLTNFASLAPAYYTAKSHSMRQRVASKIWYVCTITS